MFHTVARTLVLLGFLSSSVNSAAVRSDSLDVPWKRDGLSSLSSHRRVAARDIARRGDYGPDNRGSWLLDGFDIDVDMDVKWPDTGKTVTYNFEITNTTGSPDGFERIMFLINGQYPGPTIEANWGDNIVVNVKNSLQNNGTGIHWHGLRQLNTNQQDGTNGLSECPIAPGQTKTYSFKATQYGTSWYHSHYSIQYAEGLVGGIIIHGPATANYDVDLGVLPLTDWWHTPMFTVNAAALHAGGPPISDNILVNGSMKTGSGGKYAETILTPKKKNLLRIVNTGINNYLHVSLDGHKFKVIAADFVPIKPYDADSIVIGVGQRYDVVIDANQDVGNYWLRVGTGGGQCDGPNANPNVKSIFRYEGASTKDEPQSNGISLPTGCYDETVVPYIKTTVPSNTPKGLTLSFSQTAAQNNLVQWHINSSAMLIDFKKPTLQYVIDGNTSFPENENVYTVGEKNAWQYWVIQADSSNPPLPHPIHLHGHDFYVLDQAESAQWTGDLSKLKTDNPIRRDTASLPANGYLVLAFESDNPGAWLMHCHIPFHISAGLGLQFLERRDEILKTIGDLGSFKEGCKSWAAYQDSVKGFEQGDSGLRRR